MKKVLQLFMKLFDQKLWKFLIAGVGLTILGTVLMFVLYNLLGFGYWGSSMISYVIGGITSYFISSRWVFGNYGGKKPILQFVINILICYLLSFSLSKIIVPNVFSWLFSGLSKQLIDNIAMLLGMCFYTGFNYLGQRFLVFNSKK